MWWSGSTKLAVGENCRGSMLSCPWAGDCGIFTCWHTSPQVGQWVPRSKGRNHEDLVGPQLEDRRTEIEITTIYTTGGHKAVERHHSIWAGHNSTCHAGVHWLVGSVTYYAHFTTGRPNLTVVGPWRRLLLRSSWLRWGRLKLLSYKLTLLGRRKQWLKNLSSLGLMKHSRFPPPLSERWHTCRKYMNPNKQLTMILMYQWLT